MISNENEIKGLKVTVMGLGLHGGGTATARFFALRGAEVIVTDLGDRDVLSGSLAALEGLPITFVLGEHRDKDFKNSDLVLKNPAVPPSSPFLAMSEHVETDISIFLRLNRRPVIAVTGSKGKSTTSSAIYHALKRGYDEPCLGGNITVSPLTFLEDRTVSDWNFKIDTEGNSILRTDPVILELSSWQLADLAGMKDPFGKPVLKPEIALLTNILKDHQDRYGGMESYIRDKTNIYLGQDADQYTICNFDQETGRNFARETGAKPFFFSSAPLPADMEGAWLVEPDEQKHPRGLIRINGEVSEILPESLNLPGPHNRLNLLTAAAVCRLCGEPAERTAQSLAEFTGIAHRLELVAEKDGIRFYNDSAATIPDAVAAALDSFDCPVFLITGGTDKDLDFTPLKGFLSRPKSVFLLDGTAREKFEKALAGENRKPAGIFKDLKSAFDRAREAASEVVNITRQDGVIEKPVVLLSPGCASFGMFLNEFDRGNQFIELVRQL